MRVLTLGVVDEPYIVIARQRSAPVFVLKVIDSMRCQHDGVVLPIFDCPLWRLTGILAIGYHEIVRRQMYLQIV